LLGVAVESVGAFGTFIGLGSSIDSIVAMEKVDAGFFTRNPRSFIAIDAHSCLVRLASNASA
jgi:hypothetical protein